MNFNELLELDCYTYRMLLRDAFIYMLEQTDEGLDYLERCWVLSQTKPDYERLKKEIK